MNTVEADSDKYLWPSFVTNFCDSKNIELGVLITYHHMTDVTDYTDFRVHQRADDLRLLDLNAFD